MTNSTIILPNTSIAGRFKVVLEDNSGNVKYASDWVPNLITNLGIARFGQGDSIIQWCTLGTGDTAPTHTDVSLTSALSATVNGSANGDTTSGAPLYIRSIKRSYTFGPGVNTGLIKEFGIGNSSLGGMANSVCIHALLPVALDKQPLDQLTLYYEFFLQVDTVDSTGTFNIEGVSYDYTARPFFLQYISTTSIRGGIYTLNPKLARISDANGAAYPALVSLTQSYSDMAGVNAVVWYTDSSSFAGDGSDGVGRTHSVRFLWGIDQGNTLSTNGIRTLFIPCNFKGSNPAGYQFSIGKTSDGTPHPKENTHQFTITVSVTAHRGLIP